MGALDSGGLDDCVDGGHVGCAEGRLNISGSNGREATLCRDAVSEALLGLRSNVGETREDLIGNEGGACGGGWYECGHG